MTGDREAGSRRGRGAGGRRGWGTAWIPLAALLSLCPAAPLLGQSSLTIYNDGRVLVRREVEARIAKGASTLQLGLGALDPATIFSLDPGVTITRLTYDGATDEASVLRRSVGDVPISEAVEESARWLEEFHPRSVVELDYGGLASVLSDDALCDDDSPALVGRGLSALAKGDAETATAAYEQLVERWRSIQLLERSN